MPEDAVDLENEFPSMTELLTTLGWEREVKVACANCGQKLDMTQIAPFAVIYCPNCSAKVRRPVYFGEYVLEEQIRKRDEMTTVFRAFEPNLSRHVAVKILNPQYCASESIRQHFMKIAHLLGSFNHYAILSVYNCGEFRGLAYIVSQYTEFGTLSEFLASHQGAIPLDIAAQWAKDLVSGVRKALDSGISHGEIKPANILVDSERRLKLTGFGLYELMREAGVSTSDSYTAPEKISNTNVDEKSDIYSLGVLFYRLMTGVDPFGKKRGAGNVIPPAKRNKNISRMVSELICKMINPVPEERPNCGQVIDVLDFFLSNMEYDKRDKSRKTSAKLNFDGSLTDSYVKNDGFFEKRKNIILTVVAVLFFLTLTAVVCAVVLL